MPEFANLKDLEKYVQNNVGDALQGQTTTGVCPHCKTEEELQFMPNNKMKCLKCKSIIDIIPV